MPLKGHTPGRFLKMTTIAIGVIPFDNQTWTNSLMFRTYPTGSLLRALLVCTILLVPTVRADSASEPSPISSPSASEQRNVESAEPVFATRKKRHIVVGAEAFFPPFSEAEVSGQPKGFSIEIFKAIAKTMSLDFSTVVASRHELLTQLKAGKVDVILALAYSSQRDEYADFSIPYSSVRHVIFMRKSDRKIATLADLTNKTFITIRKGLTEDFARNKPWLRSLVFVDSIEQALLLLASGKHDGVIALRTTGLIALEKFKIENVEASPFEMQGGAVSIRFAVKAGDSELLSDINEGLSLMKSDGSYNAIRDQWYGIYDSPPGISVRQLTRYLIPIAVVVLLAAGFYLQALGRKKRRQLQHILDSITAKIWYLDTNGRVVMQNAYATKGTGRNPKEAAGKTLDTLLPSWDEPSRRQAQNLQALRSGKPILGSVESMHEDGSDIWCSVDRVPVIYKSNAAEGLLVVAHDITALKRTETELRATQERLHQIIDNIREVFWLYDVATKDFSYVSRALPMVWGYFANTKPDVGAFIRAVHPEDRDRVLAQMPNALHGQREMEFRITLTNGSIRWIRDRAFPVYDESGTIVRFAGISEDITERKATDRALRESRERFQQLEENIDAVFWLSDVKTRELIYLSTAYEKIWQRTLDNGLPTQSELLEITHPDDRDRIETKNQEAIAGPYVMEYRIGLPDNSWRWIREKGFPVRDDEGEITNIAGLAEDITQSKITHQQLRLFETAIKAVPVGIVFSDPTRPDNPLVFVNDGFELITGYSSAEVLGRNCNFLKGPNTSPAALAEMRVAIATGKSCDVVLENYRKDGTRFWNSVLITPLRDRSGNVVNFVGIQTDVTAQIDARKKLEDLNQEISHNAADLAETNKELETFAYSVSHDLRAPVRHISGFAGMLRERAGENLDETTRRYLAVISDAAKRMMELLDDLVTFSRMGRVELRKSKISLNETVNDVIRTLGASIGDRNVEWIVKPLPTITADATLIYQALLNLVENAVKYSRYKSAPRVEIGTAQPSAGQVVIYVKDNGAGFDMKYVDKLFRVFERLHRADEFEGTGIGLASVARIVGRHGGRVWVEAEVDVGATFYLELPQ
jgi:PAS domain S-box-containing protein